MADHAQPKERKKRVGPSVEGGKASRVSRAAGNIGSESMRVEQRSGSGTAGTKQRASANNGQNGSRRSKSGSGNKQKPQAPRRGPSSKYPAPVAPAPQPADSRIIGRLHGKWRALEAHSKQRIFSVLLLGLSILLLGGLTFWSRIQLLDKTGSFVTLFFGWGAYPLALGLILFAIAHLVEGVRKARFVRWSLVIGLLIMLLLLMAESYLVRKGETAGLIGNLIARPLVGWPGPTPHILLIGLVILAAIYAFRIRHGHVRSVAGFIKKRLAGPDRSSTSSQTPSPFFGQRPRFSQFTQNNAPQNNAPQTPARPGAPVDDDDDYDDIIEFEDDFDQDEDDDPGNDINLNKQQVGNVPRGNRPAPPLNRDEHEAAVKGARQQALPFDEAPQPAGTSAANHEMEPLAPNPKRSKFPKVFTRAAKTPEAESPWKLTDTSLLNNPEEVKIHTLGDDTASLAKIIQETLRSFRVEAEVRQEDISIGPTVIRFGIRPTGKPALKQDEKGRLVPLRDAAGNIVYEQRTRVSRIMALQNDLALVLEAKSIRMEAPVPGRPYVGVEIPNKNGRLVTLREVLESKEYAAARAKSKLAMALGKDVAGAVRVGDLARMPHLLIAGATGSGKSVALNAIIGSFLTQATPDDVRMLMVDPKMVELNMYNGIPHLLSPVVTEVEKVVGLLKIAIAEMEKRYRLFSQLNVRNLDGYRKLRLERMARGDMTLKNLPAIVIIIDELADLMMAAPEEVEGLICRLAQLARATGIHLIIATQRPSVDVITGLIKANIPTRISFMVSSAVDSRTIIDMGGAERLLGRGDMLYLPADAGKPERIQGAFVADDEAERLVSFWKQQAQEHATITQAQAQGGKVVPGTVVVPTVEPGWEVSEHISDEYELDDELFDQAEQVVQEYERASISLLQRRLRIGYSRAARLIDLLEERGVIGRVEAGGRAREVFDRRDRNGGEGRTMADEAADIIAEEKAREDFLKKQGNNGSGNRPPSGNMGNGRSREEG